MPEIPPTAGLTSKANPPPPLGAWVGWLLDLCPPFLFPYLERLSASPLATRFTKGAAWSLTSAVMSRGLVLAAAVIAARLLGREEFGKLGMLQSTIGMFTAFSALGLGVTGTKLIAEWRNRDPNKAGRIIALFVTIATTAGVVAGAIVFLMAPRLAAKTLTSPDLEILLKQASLLLLLGAVTGAQVGLLTGFEAFKPIARNNFIVALVTLPSLMCAIWAWGLSGAIWALVLSQGINCVLSGITLRRESTRHAVPRSWSGCWQEASVLGTFALPAYLSSLLLMPASWFCATLLVQQPGGYEQMGGFTAAFQWRAIILFVPNSILGSALPMMANLYGGQQYRALKKLLKTNLIVNVGITAAVGGGVALLSPVIMSAYGSRFADASGLLGIMALVCLLDAVTNVLAYLLISTGRMGTHLALFLFWAGTLVGVAWFLVPSMGSKGLALSYLAAQAAYALAQTAYFLPQWRTSRNSQSSK